MFKLHSNNWQPYFAAPDGNAGGGGVPSSEMSKDDILDYLKDDDDDKGDDDKSDDLDEGDDDKGDSKSKDKKKDKDTKKEKPKSKDKDDSDDDDDDDSKDDEDDDELDLDELEESLDDKVDEEKLELVTPVSRAKILKKYPELFKDFPYLEKAYFREQQFTEIFSHPDDAKQALEKAETLDKFETDLFSGNTETILRAIKSETPEAFNKLVDNYLPTLFKIDKDAHTHVVGNTIKQTIIAMVDEARNSDNKALEQAAQILNQFVFASSKFTPPTKLASESKTEVVDEEKVQLRKRSEELVRQRFEDARGELNSRVNNSIKATIEQNIDPRNSMTDYVKRTAVRDALEQVEKLITQDTRFKSIVDRLWEKSFKENFSRASQETIRSAYMTKAKTLLDSVIKKSRNEALRGMGKRVKDEDKDTNNKSSRRDQRKDDDEKPRSRNNSGKSSDIPRGMSTLEFLMKDDD